MQTVRLRNVMFRLMCPNCIPTLKRNGLVKEILWDMLIRAVDKYKARRHLDARPLSDLVKDNIRQAESHT